jgi:hypothetical protein
VRAANFEDRVGWSKARGPYRARTYDVLALNLCLELAVTRDAPYPRVSGVAFGEPLWATSVFSAHAHLRRARASGRKARARTSNGATSAAGSSARSESISSPSSSGDDSWLWDDDTEAMENRKGV